MSLFCLELFCNVYGVFEFCTVLPMQFLLCYERCYEIKTDKLLSNSSNSQ